MEHQFLHLIIALLVQQPKCKLIPNEHSMYIRFLCPHYYGQLLTSTSTNFPLATITLAYFTATSITKQDVFVTQTTRVFTIKLFSLVIYLLNQAVLVTVSNLQQVQYLQAMMGPTQVNTLTGLCSKCSLCLQILDQSVSD